MLPTLTLPAAQPSLVLDTPASQEQVSSFLDQYRPSANDNEYAWYWARQAGAQGEGTKERDEKVQALSLEGVGLVQGLVDECEVIKQGTAAPPRKRSGTSPKWKLLKEAHARFSSDIKQLAQRYGVVSGKWVLFVPTDEVDGVWAKAVRLFAYSDSPLAATGAVDTIKVSPVAGKDGRHLICIYTKDCYNEVAVEKVLEVILKQLRVKPTGYKPDIYTRLGIYWNHPSGLSPVLYRPSDFLAASEIDRLLEKQTQAKAVQPKTLAEEVAAGGADGFDSMYSTSSDDEAVPQKKKAKKE
ncbi:hypothetical protein JCM10207_008793 [Rhodosporidiobolus poonsookiae]